MRAKTAKVRTHSRTVAILAYDGLALFEFSAAVEAFSYDHSVPPNQPWYRLLICSADGGSVSTDSGLQLGVPHGLDQLAEADTIVVPPCEHPDGAPEEVLAALRRAHARGARILSLCTGAFVLAAAGLLTGRTVTTHWTEAAELARRYPSLTVDPNVLYIDDGDILTSAGSAASIDLCLQVIRTDHGADVANDVARALVVPPYRDGGQAQYIDTPLPELSASDPFADTVAWIQRNLDRPITVAELARQATMSRRTFARRFTAATGSTPYQWLLRQRLQLAQRLLETTDLAVEAVAQHSGFVNAGNLRKQFTQQLQTTPVGYRQTFRRPG